MANTFKNAALTDVTTDSAYDTLYTAPGATTSIILGLSIANKTANSIPVSVRFNDNSASTDYQLLNEISIPGNTTLETLAGQKYVLETSDALKVKAGTDSSIDVILGLMEIT
jgi:hypothetical protein